MRNLFELDSFSNQGKRDNNEDCVFPNADISTELDNLFLVCDGVGGLDKGEIASDLCCSQFNAYFTTNKIEVSNEETIDEAVRFVEKKFDSYMTNNPESINMASTITLLHLHKKGATVSHMGDSRIYHIRDGKILFRTKDHSVVQEMFDAGIIESEEDMATHRDRNRISRAMRGASVKSYKADTTVITDLKEEDFFFMCTDGVLEAFSDKELQEVFSSTKDVETINAKIVRKCAEISNDNYSAYTVKLTSEYIDTLVINTGKTTPLIGEEETEEEGSVEKIENQASKTQIQPTSKEDNTEEDMKPQVEENSETKEINKTEIPSSKTEIKQPEKTTEEVNKEVHPEPQEKIEQKEQAEPLTSTTPFSTQNSQYVDPLKQRVPDNEEDEELDESTPSSLAKNKNLKIILLVLLALLVGYLVYSNFFQGDKKEGVTIEKVVEDPSSSNEVPTSNERSIAENKEGTEVSSNSIQNASTVTDAPSQQSSEVDKKREEELRRREELATKEKQEEKVDAKLKEAENITRQALGKKESEKEITTPNKQEKGNSKKKRVEDNLDRNNNSKNQGESTGSSKKAKPENVDENTQKNTTDSNEKGETKLNEVKVDTI